jgi:hypothetical protein
MGVSPDDIKEKGDLPKIPLVEEDFYKRYPSNGKDFAKWLGEVYTGEMPEPEIGNDFSHDEVIWALENKGVITAFSTGSTGRFTYIPRDELTWKRLVYGLSEMVELWPFIPHSSKDVLIAPTPGPEVKGNQLFPRLGRDAVPLFTLGNDVEMHYASGGGGRGGGEEKVITTDLIKLSMGITEGIKDKMKAKVVQKQMANEGKEVTNRLIEVLEKCDREGKRVSLMPPPFVVIDLLTEMEKRGMRFNLEDGINLSMMGWKSHLGQEMNEEEYKEKVKKLMGINTFVHTWGQNECNAYYSSCEGEYLHIPHSVTYPMVLDENFEPMDYGEWGRLAYLDACGNSYPSFIITADKVKLLEHCPVCDRPGPVLDHHISRVTGVEDRGCAAILSRILGREVEKARK